MNSSNLLIRQGQDNGELHSIHMQNTRLLRQTVMGVITYTKYIKFTVIRLTFLLHFLCWDNSVVLVALAASPALLMTIVSDGEVMTRLGLSFLVFLVKDSIT